MKFTKLVAASLLAMTAIPAAAQSEVDLSVGASVYGPDDSLVGTIDRVVDGVVVVNTGNNTATLGAESFVAGTNGPTIGFTRVQLDEAIDAREREAEAKLTAALTVGAQLRSNDGVIVGSIQAVNDDGSIIVSAEEMSYRLERNQLSTDAQGVILLYSAAQLEAALGG
jgi:hypothetical protein